MALLDLAAGLGIRIDGADWTVGEVSPHLGRVVLTVGDGNRRVRPIGWLVERPGETPCFQLHKGFEALQAVGADCCGFRPVGRFALVCTAHCTWT
ncbi:hypothetical protein [Streptomyces fumanus]|uniref:Uncharacterized protein n=1 Tax=Streptomyces fumanus TaxID=67302 RepID=A0A919ACI1_9ACTN|nr:hypothetical protein [Streptomyces fumanus]GHE98801.1 hypothetical protein GCM10018772_24070 [Streptomyces fumanus]